MAFFDLLCGALGKIGFVPAFVIKVHIMKEAARIKGVGELLIVLELGFSPVCPACDCAAAQIDADAEADCIHDLDGACEMLRRVIDVLMEVDCAMLGAPLVCLRVELKVGWVRWGGKRSD